jgi:molybdate transport system substrate-binding protein
MQLPFVSELRIAQRWAAAGLLAYAVLVCGSAIARAESAGIAVASNFTAVAEQLAEEFTAGTGHTLTLSFGASGQLYAQISQGAPFDVFLSADDIRPAQAVAEGLGVEGTVFAYAIGALALYSPSLAVAQGDVVLQNGDFEKLAIADPQTAPYGRAAMEAIASLGLSETLAPKLVTGENISQALQFVESGNAELGLLAASQVAGKDNVWMVPAEFYEPIRQDAAAQGFLAFLKSPEAAAVIEAAGYAVARP